MLSQSHPVTSPATYLHVFSLGGSWMVMRGNVGEENDDDAPISVVATCLRSKRAANKRARLIAEQTGETII